MRGFQFAYIVHAQVCFCGCREHGFIHLQCLYITPLAFPADIGRKPASLARGSNGNEGDVYTPANETADDTKDNGFSIFEHGGARKERDGYA